MATIDKRGPYQYRVRIRRAGIKDQVRTFRSQEEAELWSAEVELELDRGTFVCQREAQQTTVADALERYYREVSAKKKGWKAELSRKNDLQNQPWAALSLTELRPPILVKWRDDQLKNSAPNTVRLKLALLSHLYTTARKEWGMETLLNPVAAMKLPQVRNERDRRVLPHDEARLLEHADPVMAAIIVLAIETAMRRSELIGLNWSDVGPTYARLRDTKNGRPRVVPLSTRARASLPTRGDGRVFDIHVDTVSHRFQDLCNLAGLSDVRFHDLRHEGTSRLFEKGLSMMEVATITGHRSLSMLQRYAHLQIDELAAKLG